MKTSKARTRRVLQRDRSTADGHTAPFRPGSLATARGCRRSDAPLQNSVVKETILVVHPLQPMRETVADTVRQCGYRVLEATSAIQAQLQIKAEPDIRL